MPATSVENGENDKGQVYNNYSLLLHLFQPKLVSQNKYAGYPFSIMHLSIGGVTLSVHSLVAG
jgi:hypothetical protein